MKNDAFSVRALIWVHHWATLFGSLVGILSLGFAKTNWSLETARWIARRRMVLRERVN